MAVHQMVSEFKEARVSEIPALNELRMNKINPVITKKEVSSEILCILEQLYDIIPGIKPFVSK